VKNSGVPKDPLILVVNGRDLIADQFISGKNSILYELNI
jgi:hypothetical protein